MVWFTIWKNIHPTLNYTFLCVSSMICNNWKWNEKGGRMCVCIRNGKKKARKKEIEESKGKSTNDPPQKKRNGKTWGQNDITIIKMLKEMVRISSSCDHDVNMKLTKSQLCSITWCDDSMRIYIIWSRVNFLNTLTWHYMCEYED
jgi:hypothetical protein